MKEREEEEKEGLRKRRRRKTRKMKEEEDDIYSPIFISYHIELINPSLPNLSSMFSISSHSLSIPPFMSPLIPPSLPFVMNPSHYSL